MYDRSYIRTFLIHSHVHLDLGRGFESRIRLDHFTFCVYLTDILRCHESFGHTCGGAEELIVIELYGNVSVVCSHHIAVVDPSADVANLFFDFKFVYHAIFLLKHFGFFFISKEILLLSIRNVKEILLFYVVFVVSTLWFLLFFEIIHFFNIHHQVFYNYSFVPIVKNVFFCFFRFVFTIYYFLFSSDQVSVPRASRLRLP